MGVSRLRHLRPLADGTNAMPELPPLQRHGRGGHLRREAPRGDEACRRSEGVMPMKPTTKADEQLDLAQELTALTKMLGIAVGAADGLGEHVEALTQAVSDLTSAIESAVQFARLARANREEAAP
jgi:hypothetical protein